MTLSQGEMMVWAAAYARELDGLRRLRGDETTMSRTTQAIEVASLAVTQLRDAEKDVIEGFGPPLQSTVTDMYRKVRFDV